MSFSNELQNRMILGLKKDSCGDVYFGNIDYIHNKVHQGKMLFVGEVYTVANLGEVYVHFTAGSSKYVHAFAGFSSVGEWRFTSYAGTTYTDNGTEITQINRKSDSSYVPEVKFYKNLVGDIDVLGTQRLDFVFGSGTNPARAGSGSVNEEIESVFAPDSDVLIKVINNSGAEQLLSVLFNYYEEE